MNSSASCGCSRRSASRLSTCAWMDRSRALTGSSHDHQPRSQHQRAGDRDPLPLPAGELRAGKRPAASAGSPTALQHARRPASRAWRPSATRMHPQRLGERLADGLRRVERAVGVLEHDVQVDGCDPAPPQRRPGDVRRREAHRPVGRRLRPRMAWPIVDLPEPDSPTRPRVSPRRRRRG